MRRPPPGAGPDGLEALLVVVPARDEAAWLPGCLAALARALGHPAVAGLDRDAVVVLDRCRDASAAVVAAAGVRGLPVLIGSAGGARRAGVADGLMRLRAAGHDPSRTWITSTDADSLVPPDWLAVHSALAAEGADLVRGTVVLVPADPRADPHADPEYPDPVAAAWEAAYRRVDGHPHVHGANLGVRASTYLAAGGFPPVGLHEDVLLAHAVERQGGRVVATAAAPVTTSARVWGRTAGGVAGDLRRLGELMRPPA